AAFPKSMLAILWTGQGCLFSDRRPFREWTWGFWERWKALFLLEYYDVTLVVIFLKKYATSDKMADGPKGIVLYALLGIAISLAFGYLVYHKASAVMYDQSLAELKRSADASGAEFRVRLD
ncbi:MAG: hypothetical protein ACYDEQ_09410, partial [Desulfocucumaceae bacterium]